MGVKFGWYYKMAYLCPALKQNAEIAQLVEHNLAKVRVASSSLVFRSTQFGLQLPMPRWRNW